MTTCARVVCGQINNLTSIRVQTVYFLVAIQFRSWPYFPPLVLKVTQKADTTIYLGIWKIILNSWSGVVATEACKESKIVTVQIKMSFSHKRRHTWYLCKCDQESSKLKGVNHCFYTLKTRQEQTYSDRYFTLHTSVKPQNLIIHGCLISHKYANLQHNTLAYSWLQL